MILLSHAVLPHHLTSFRLLHINSPMPHHLMHTTPPYAHHLSNTTTTQTTTPHTLQVTINAIENAASIAALVLTTEVLITEIPKKEPAFIPNDPE
jgi:hypothetical protein